MIADKGYVYFLQPVTGGPIKIGWSAYPEGRLATYMSWSPLPLKLVAKADAPFHAEQMLHHRLEKHRLHHEWFRPAPEVLRVVDHVIRTGSLDQETDDTATAYRPGIHVASRLGTVLEENGLTVEALAEFLGKPARKVARWKGGRLVVPHKYVAQVLRFFTDHQKPIAPTELYAEIKWTPQRMRRPITPEALDHATALARERLTRTHRGYRLDERVRTVRALNDALHDHYWPRSKNVAAAAGIPPLKVTRFLNELVAAGIVWRNPDGLATYGFADFIEEWGVVGRRCDKRAA